MFHPTKTESQASQKAHEQSPQEPSRDRMRHSSKQIRQSSLRVCTHDTRRYKADIARSSRNGTFMKAATRDAVDARPRRHRTASPAASAPVTYFAAAGGAAECRI